LSDKRTIPLTAAGDAEPRVAAAVRRREAMLAPHARPIAFSQWRRSNLSIDDLQPKSGREWHRRRDQHTKSGAFPTPVASYPYCKIVFVACSDPIEAARVLASHGLDLTDMETWTEWQSEVVMLLKRDFEEVLGHISIEEIDWPSWRNYYEQGRSPRSAIERALELDL
jgi:hypothetical protein